MKKLIRRGLILGVVLTGIGAASPAGAVVYSPQGQALKTLAAFEDALLDRVIAATEIGVRSMTTGKVATGWGISRFAGSALSPLLTITISAAGLAWSPYIQPWLTEKGWWVSDGVVLGEGEGGYYIATDHAGSTIEGGHYHVVFPSVAAAQAVYNACGTSSYSCIRGSWSYTWWDCYKVLTWGAAHGCVPGVPEAGYNYVDFMIAKSSGYLEWQAADPVEVPDATVTSSFETDFQTDGSTARQVAIDLVNYLGDKTEEANKEWPGTVPDASGYSPFSSAQGDTVQQAMNDSIDPQAKTELQESADQNGTMPAPGSTQGPAGNDWEYTPEQMAAAQNVKDLEREAAWLTDWESAKPDDGNESTPTAGDYTLPERKDLEGVLDTFKSGLGSLPIISWANGVELEVSGASSIINLPLPTAWGSSITVDFADYEDILDMMGAGLYALVGMASVLFLFRGRGD